MSGFDEQRFMELVEQSEREACDNISRYKLKLALFAALGYTVIFFIFTLLLGLIGGTIALALASTSLFLLLVKKKFIIVIVATAWLCLRALWVKFDAPTGLELHRKDYPVLFAEIDQLRRELKALKIHQVILRDNLNAAVIQTPRFGVLGGQRNTLFLGLELLLVLNPAEARAVLAHEFGHLSGDHSSFSGWIYRVRVSWQRIMEAFEQNDSFAAKLMQRFFNWYAPTFSAYSFALARNNEYEADRIAAQLTSPKDAASALVNIHAQAPHLQQRYWREYFQQADNLPEPPSLPYSGLAQYLQQNPITRAQLLEQIKKAMREETHYADTHPALKDRLANIIDTPVLPVIGETSAKAWLGDKLPSLIDHFDQEWLTENKQRWHNRYAYATKAKAALSEAETADLCLYDDQQLWDLACYSDEFAAPELAIERYRLYQQRNPSSPGAAYYLGRLLADKDDLSALEQFSIALDRNSTFRAAADLGYALVERVGNTADKSRWETLVDEKYQRLRAAYLERAEYNPAIDQIVPSTIEGEALTELRRILGTLKVVGDVWLAEKVLRDPDVFNAPLYILAFQPKGLFTDADDATEKVTNALAEFGEFIVVATKGDAKKIAKVVQNQGRKIK